MNVLDRELELVVAGVDPAGKVEMVADEEIAAAVLAVVLRLAQLGDRAQPPSGRVENLVARPQRRVIAAVGMAAREVSHFGVQQHLLVRAEMIPRRLEAEVARLDGSRAPELAGGVAKDS